MPPGTVISVDAYPLIVMRDRVGWFIYEMGEPFRHYCLSKRHAIRDAAAWRKHNGR